MAEVVLLPDRVPSLGRAVEQFLAAKPLSPNARRSYAYCLAAVGSFRRWAQAQGFCIASGMRSYMKAET